MTMTTLPAPRPVLWPLRPQESARVSRSDDSGRRIVTIEHAPLRGVTVEGVTERSAIISRRIAGSSVVRLENEFESTDVGARYVTRMTLGDDTLPGRLLLNRIARTKALPPPKLERWIRHHIEEIGNLEHFLPTLFEARAPIEP
jgi:hypothetical protein